MSFEIFLDKNSAYIPRLQLQSRIDYDDPALRRKIELFRYLRLYPDLRDEASEAGTAEKAQLYSDLIAFGNELFGMLVPADKQSLASIENEIILCFRDVAPLRIPWELISLGEDSLGCSVGVVRKLMLNLSSSESSNPLVKANSFSSLLSSTPWFDAESSPSDSANAAVESAEYCHLPNFWDMPALLRKEFGSGGFSFDFSLNERSFRDMHQKGSAVVILSAFCDDFHWYFESSSEKSCEKIDTASVALALRKAIANGLKLLVLNLEKAPGKSFDVMSMLCRLQTSLPNDCVVFQGRMSQLGIKTYVFTLLANLYSKVSYHESHRRALEKIRAGEKEGWDWCMPVLFSRLGDDSRGSIDVGPVDAQSIQKKPYEMFQDLADHYTPLLPISPKRHGQLKKKLAANFSPAATKAVSVSGSSLWAYLLALRADQAQFKANDAIFLSSLYWDALSWTKSNGFEDAFPISEGIESYLAENVFRSPIGSSGEGSSVPAVLLIEQGEGQDALEAFADRFGKQAKLLLYSANAKPEDKYQSLDTAHESELLGTFNYSQRERILEAGSKLPRALLLNPTVCRLLAYDGPRLMAEDANAGAILDDDAGLHGFLSYYWRIMFSSTDQLEALCIFYLIGGMVDIQFLGRIYKRNVKQKDYAEFINRGILLCDHEERLIGMADNISSFISKKRPVPKSPLTLAADFISERIFSIINREDPEGLFTKECARVLQHLMIACLKQGLSNEAVRCILRATELKEPKSFVLNAGLCKALFFRALIEGDSSTLDYFKAEHDLLSLMTCLSPPKRRELLVRLKNAAKDKHKWVVLSACHVMETLLDFAEGGEEQASGALKRTFSLLLQTQKKQYWPSFAISYLTMVYIVSGKDELKSKLGEVQIFADDLDSEKMAKLWIFSAVSNEDQRGLQGELEKAKSLKNSNYRATLIDAIAYEYEGKGKADSEPEAAATLFAGAADIFAANLLEAKANRLRMEAGMLAEKAKPEEAIKAYLSLYRSLKEAENYKELADCADRLGSLYYKIQDKENSTKFYAVAKKFMGS